MALETIVQRILAEPAPEDLWALQPLLLASESPAAPPAYEVAQSFHRYLVNVRSKLTSKEYSLLGAALAATSIGIIAVRDLLDSATNDRAHLLQNALAGGLAGATEGFATLQHVRAWETEFGSVHDEALWDLYAILWRLSVEGRADQAPETRHTLIEQLLAPARSNELDGLARMAYLIRLYQIALLLRLHPLLAVQRKTATPEGESA